MYIEHMLCTRDRHFQTRCGSGTRREFDIYRGRPKSPGLGRVYVTVSLGSIQHGAGRYCGVKPIT